MNEKNFKNFLNYVSEATAEEEYSMQEESMELRKARQECQECEACLQNMLPEKYHELISNFEEAKNLESAIESDIAVVVAIRFLIRLLKCLELL